MILLGEKFNDMHSNRSFHIFDLLDRLPDETVAEFHDRIRRNVSASKVRFESGKMALTRAAIAELARAVIQGKLPGCLTRAYQLLVEIEPSSHGPDMWISNTEARRIYQEIIGGRIKGNVTVARKQLALLNRLLKDG